MSDECLIDGKPFCSEEFGRFIYLSMPVFRNEEHLEEMKRLLYEYAIKVRNRSNKNLEIKNLQYIVHPAKMFNGSPYDPLNAMGSIGIRFFIFGRAYQVKRLLRKGKKRYKRVRVNGHLKWKRIDKKKRAHA